MKVKAAVATAPGQIEVKWFDYPGVAKDALLVKIEMCGICGTDKHIYKGELKLYEGTEAETEVHYPLIQGHENVGIIAEIGAEAATQVEFYGRELHVGDRIVMCPDLVCGECWYCKHIHAYPWCERPQIYGVSLGCSEPPYLFGGMSEYMYLLPNTFVYKVPESLSPEIAVLTELMAVTYNLDKAKEFYSLASEGFGSGDTIVIQGVGPLGLMHVIKARIMGAGDIIALDKSSFRLDMARKFGANYTMNVGETSSEERIEYVRELTDGRGADIVVDCAGLPEALVEGLEMLRRGGTYIETGAFVETGYTSLSPHRHLCAKAVRLIGMTNHPFTGYGPTMKLMERYKGIIPFEQVITHRFTIDEAEKAIRKSTGLDSMKVVVTP